MRTNLEQIDHVFVYEVVNLGTVLRPLPLCSYDLLVELLFIVLHVSVNGGILIGPRTGPP